MNALLLIIVCVYIITCIIRSHQSNCKCIFKHKWKSYSVGPQGRLCAYEKFKCERCDKVKIITENAFD